MKIAVNLIGQVYKNIAKPILFKFDPELIHNRITDLAESTGDNTFFKNIFRCFFDYEASELEQNLHGIDFKNPCGLAAGFDYEAKLTQSLSSLNFGFQTVGTITNNSYEGNPRPMLGRLPKSKSLMVNKGFKNPGADKIIEKLEKLNFDIPLGISIGRTNSQKLVSQNESVNDIIQTFTKFEKSKVKNAYYELNISCPNLFGDVTFYPTENLKELLSELKNLNISKPVFIKMPIEKTDEDVLRMMEIIPLYNIKGVIFGNLQKNRKDPALHQDEVAKFAKGNFSGKPTYARSNELIRLAYKYYGKSLTIIGCGGIFNANDAYEKIKAGASLVQLITGLIYEGPQLVSQMNRELVNLLKTDGFKNISDAVGTENKKP